MTNEFLLSEQSFNLITNFFSKHYSVHFLTLTFSAISEDSCGKTKEIADNIHYHSVLSISTQFQYSLVTNCRDHSHFCEWSLF